MKLTYVLKNKSIYYRFRNGRNLSILRKLSYEIQEKDWSTAKQLAKPKELQSINTQLIKFKAFLMNEYNLAIVNEINIDLQWVKKMQHAFFKTSESDETYKIYLKKYIEYYIREEKPKSNNFNILKNQISTTTRLIDVDIKWMEKFSKSKLKIYAESTIGKHIQQVKIILKHAEKNGIKIRRSAVDFKSKKYTTINTYLNEQELDAIFKYEYHTDYLNNAKRLFLVGSTTGLRVSDLMRVKEFKIDNNFMELVTKKTKQPIIIPLDPRVRDYIPLLRPISHPKFNKYIKEVCKLAGINEQTKGYIRGNRNIRELGVYPKYMLISSHTMRRSFATNLYGKLPSIIIMAITGHTTEKSFLTYIKKPQRDFAEQLQQFYREKHKA